jgi:integrase
MGITFNLELNSKPNKSRSYAVLLRITQDKKHIRKKTSVEVRNKSDFNPKAKQGKWIRTSEPNHKKWNDVLEKEIEEAKNTYRELKTSGSATKELIIEKITSSDTFPSFLDYAKERTQDIYNEGGYRNYKKYNGFCNKLENYLTSTGKKDILFSELTPTFLARFEAHLHTLHNARHEEAKLHPSTISLTLRIFKTLVNRAVMVEKIIKPEMNPFLGYKYAREKSSPKEKLNGSEIAQIEELELPEGSLIWHCKNFFLFSFYMAGIRAGDLIQLRWINITSDGRLEYRMGKTKKDRSLRLHTKAMDILQHYYREDSKPTDYIFPLLRNDAPYATAVTEDQRATLTPEMIRKLTNDVSSKNALINKYLKKIAAHTSITKNISFHISRHSFARIAKEKRVDNNHLKNLLGHSDLKITEAYMGNFDTEETDNVMNSIFEEKLDEKANIKELLRKMDPLEIEMIISELKKEESTDGSASHLAENI